MIKMLLVGCLLIATSSLCAADAVKGKALYKKCTSCHGKDGYGKRSQKAPLIAGQHDWYLESQIKNIRDKKRVSKNTKKMYPFVKKLNDEQVTDLAAYISSLVKK